MKRAIAVVLGVLLVVACAAPRVEQQAGPFRQSVGPGGVQQSAGPWGPSQSVGPGGVRQSAGSPPSGPTCQTDCGGQSYSVSCPAGANPVCQCQHEPYAACMVPGRTTSGG